MADTIRKYISKTSADTLRSEGTRIGMENGKYYALTENEQKDKEKEEKENIKKKKDVAHIKGRRNAFPSVKEQLDMQYWDKINGTSLWEDMITKVKSDNPKFKKNKKGA